MGCSSDVVVTRSKKMNKSNGMVKEDVNSNWVGDQYTADRERLLYRLQKIEKFSSTQGYYGQGNCKLCGCGTPYGSRRYGDVEWPVDIQHYIEYHGHKPTDDELDAMHFSFNEFHTREEFNVKQGISRMARITQENKK